jgi:hypothetical protein
MSEAEALAGIVCCTCKQRKPDECFNANSLRIGYRRCFDCNKSYSTKNTLKSRIAKRENPWLKKLLAIKKNIQSPSVRKLWTAEKAKQVWLSYSKRCAYSNIELDEKDVAFVRRDKHIDLTPCNAVVINRWRVRYTKADAFEWTKDQLDRIEEAQTTLV